MAIMIKEQSVKIADKRLMTVIAKLTIPIYQDLLSMLLNVLKIKKLLLAKIVINTAMRAIFIINVILVAVGKAKEGAKIAVKQSIKKIKNI